MRSTRARIGWLGLAIAMSTLAVTTSAVGDDSIEALRRDLERLEASPGPIPAGTIRSLAYQVDVAERVGQAPAARWRSKARRYLDQALSGTDPLPLARGEIINRSYPTPVSLKRQGYAVYVPPDYDPARAYPLLVVLHGGSSNGNLFLGVVLGNNMSWERYSEYLWDEFVPRTFPDLIIASPDGFGQVMWRWMGERDVLDVIDDVQRHYHVDADRITLMGLSNGGVGAYAIGARHAWRFNVVQAVAGAPSWLMYAGGSPQEPEQVAMRRFSATHLADNFRNTDFRFYHGRTDTGPMRPHFITRFEEVLRERGVESNVTWYDAGHDILYRVHRHGRRFNELASVRRNRRPSEVYIETGDYRANRQHWVTINRIVDYPRVARATARADAASLRVETSRVSALSLDLRDAPITGSTVRLTVDESEVYSGPLNRLGHVVHLHRTSAANWALGFPPETELRKRPGSSGPLTDAYRDRMVHVVGTQNQEHTAELQRAAERASRGWPLWLWHVKQEVVEDTAVTPELMGSAHLVLYGSHGDNSVLSELAQDLPIVIAEDAVVVGETRFAGRDVGVRFIYPNPRAPERYVIVQGGVTPSAVARGNNLPDFLPDYVVYDDRTTARRERLAFNRGRPLAHGYFDDAWQLRTTPSGNGNDPSSELNFIPSTLPIPPAPPTPPRPTTFSVPPEDPAGVAARAIAQRVATFESFRSLAPGATWRVDRRSIWSIRSATECHRELQTRGLVFRPRADFPTPVPSPVEILGPIRGVWFRMMHEDRPLVVSCELASKLADFADVLRRHHVRGVDVMSAYRTRPRASFHTMGLALDVGRFWTDRGFLDVSNDFEITADEPTCEGSTETQAGRRLRALACALAEAQLFQTLITPNYNEGHRDHWHLDIRPDDPRLFVR